jgi:hypothetical protein
MKLRKIGNSLGAIFTRDLLALAGFDTDHDLQITAEPGAIHIRSNSPKVVVAFTSREAEALVLGQNDTKAGISAIRKIQRIIDSN